MSRILAASAIVLMLIPAAAAVAQSDDAAYCNALAQRYRTYVRGSISNKSFLTPTADVQSAMDHCSDKPGASIPLLERKLQDAKVDLPSRS